MSSAISLESLRWFAGPQGTTNLVELGEGNPGILFVIVRRRNWDSFFESCNLCSEFRQQITLAGESKKLFEEEMNGLRRTLMEFVDMPVNKGTDKVEVKELLKRKTRNVLHMREKAVIPLKMPTIVIESDRTLPKRCISATNNRSGGPVLKIGEGLLEIGRPVLIREIGPIGTSSGTAWSRGFSGDGITRGKCLWGE